MRHRLFVRGAIGAASAALLAGVVTTVPASASVQLVTTCGTVITSAGTYVVANDLGPCTGDGIDVAHNNVTLSLNGHTITGNDTNNHTANEQLGVLLANVTGVKVHGPGTITAFDGGVAVLGGGNDSVSKVVTHDNINHVLEPEGGVINPTTHLYGDPNLNPCNYGDGILTDNSSHDVISSNTSYHNGPFSGIALVDVSTHNQVTGNTVYTQSVYNQVFQPNDTPPDYTSGPCGPFGSNTIGVGRADQDIGIRVEGPGATNNTVANNHSFGNMLEGIAIHGHVCSTSTTPPPTPDNSSNTVTHNVVSANGNDKFAPGMPNGIGVLQQGPAGTVCPSDNETITDNLSTSNANDGIYVAGRGFGGDTIHGNSAHGNGNDGIELSGTSSPLPGATGDTVTGNDASNNKHDGIQADAGSASNTLSENTAKGNPTFDAEDDNATCGTNTWSSDVFGTVNQFCVT